MKKMPGVMFASLLLVFANSAVAVNDDKKYEPGTGGRSQEMMSEQGKAHEQASENRMKRGDDDEEEGKEKKEKKQKKHKKEKKSKKGR